MKISNETKVGALAAVVISLFILGFNFLKGNKIFSSNVTLHAKYSNIQGLTTSNPVIINGMQVGIVKEISNDNNMREIAVALSIRKDINIPSNSIALIIPNPLTVTKIEIRLGDNNQYLKNNDTIHTEANKGILDDVMKKVDPVLYEVKNAVGSLDTLLGNVNSIVDPDAKKNLASTISNLNKISFSLLNSTAALQQILNNQSGSLAKSLDNINAFTGNLANKNSQVSSIINNLDQTTGKISQMDLQKTLTGIESAITELKTLMAKMNSNEGSLGLLVNDPTLYRNISSTGNKLNLLLDDLRLHPKRYVNISVFGKKQQDAPLMQPLPDTLSAPYLPKKSN